MRNLCDVSLCSSARFRHCLLSTVPSSEPPDGSGCRGEWGGGGSRRWWKTWASAALKRKKKEKKAPEDILCFLSCSSSQSGQQHFEAGESSTFQSQTAAHFIFEKHRLPHCVFHREALITRNKLELIFKCRPWLQISSGAAETSRQMRLSEDILMQPELESSARVSAAHSSNSTFLPRKRKY